MVLIVHPCQGLPGPVFFLSLEYFFLHLGLPSEDAIRKHEAGNPNRPHSNLHRTASLHGCFSGQETKGLNEALRSCRIKKADRNTAARRV
jgi:hypothetical protein